MRKVWQMSAAVSRGSPYILDAIRPRGSSGCKGLRPPFFPRSGGRQTRACPFLNQLTLKLGERGKDLEDEFARGGGGIQRAVTQRPKAHLVPE
jgi:hypothetical protein